MATYLTLVNRVLRRLRVTQVGSVSENEYSAMIGEFVNDAKRVVEDSWDWQALQREVTFNLSPSVQDYNLSSALLVGAGNVLTDRARLLNEARSKLPLAFDISTESRQQLVRQTRDWIIWDRAIQTTPNNQPYPMFFAIDRKNEAVWVRLNEIPTQARTWQMTFCDPQPDLVNGTDNMLVPELPVILLAVHYALNERGEEIGEAATLSESRFQIALSDAIAYDAMYQDRKTDFEVV